MDMDFLYPWKFLLSRLLWRWHLIRLYGYGFPLPVKISVVSPGLKKTLDYALWIWFSCSHEDFCCHACYEDDTWLDFMDMVFLYREDFFCHACYEDDTWLGIMDMIFLSPWRHLLWRWHLIRHHGYEFPVSMKISAITPVMKMTLD